MEHLCGCFGYTQQAYYQRLQEQIRTSHQREAVLPAVHQCRHQLPMIGTLKLHHLLQQQGFDIGQDALFDLL